MKGVELQVEYSASYFMEVNQKFTVWFDFRNSQDVAMDVLRESVKKGIGNRRIMLTLAKVASGEKPSEYIRYIVESDYKGGFIIQAGELEGYCFQFKDVFNGTERQVKKAFIGMIEQEINELKLEAEQSKEVG